MVFWHLVLYDMLNTAQDYINFALKASGALGVGQTALAEDNADALSALNGMLGLMAKSALAFVSSNR